ncbi:LacI family DNA-binding transcriptional regulator [Mesorhizobium sp. CN2-181]|uniref:LacI family DNA-binding transcriptional regulator n=1 Tax=Mesorhizobium yinganensis TaxID=3157707 RepID=UPI0032B826D7
MNTDPPRSLTIADVAERAGVSRAVASRALSPEPRPVSADKRERVLKAAAELGFKPNFLAQSLTSKSVNLVAVVVNHIHDLSDLDLFDRLIDRVQAAGKQVILLRVGSVARVEEFLRRGIAYHVDAALVFSDFADAATMREMFRSDHVVMLNGRHDRLSPAVIPDEAVGIEAAVADAAGKGVSKVALLTGRPSSEVEHIRIAAYRKSFARHGISVVREAQGDYSYESGHAAAEALVCKNPPQALFCTSDAMAMGVLDARRADFPGNRPERFRLYGFDNLSLTSFDAYPIASIGYDKARYVEEIATMLMRPQAMSQPHEPVRIPTAFFPRATAD